MLYSPQKNHLVIIQAIYFLEMRNPVEKRLVQQVRLIQKHFDWVVRHEF
jgi:hypothetical protein